jgi:hypothetical protein
MLYKLRLIKVYKKQVKLFSAKLEKDILTFRFSQIGIDRIDFFTIEKCNEIDDFFNDVILNENKIQETI